MASAEPAISLIGSDASRVALHGGGAEKPLRIAMMTNLFHPVATGSSTQVRGLAKALAALGHQVIVITAHVDSATPTHERMDGFEVFRIPALHLPKMAISLNFPWLNWTFWPKNLKRMEAILREHRIDLLHVHNHMFDMAFAGRVLGRRLGLPLVVTMHTVIKHANAAYDALLRFVDGWFLRQMVVRHADCVVCPDNNMNAYVVERFQRTDTRVVTYGVDEPDFVDEAEVEALRREYELSGHKVIVSIGHVHAIRNRHELVRALPLLERRIPNVKLLIVGGVFDGSPEKLSKELGVNDHVIFAGAQPRRRISAFLRVADVEAHWLNQDEGTWSSPGLASMEAMFAGLPVFTVAPANIYGDGVLVNGRNVLLVQRDDIEALADKLCSVLSDAGLAASIGAEAEKTCQRYFSWPHIAQRTSGIYRELVADKVLRKYE